MPPQRTQLGRDRFPLPGLRSSRGMVRVAAPARGCRGPVEYGRGPQAGPAPLQGLPRTFRSSQGHGDGVDTSRLPEAGRGRLHGRVEHLGILRHEAVPGPQDQAAGCLASWLRNPRGTQGGHGPDGRSVPVGRGLFRRQAKDELLRPTSGAAGRRADWLELKACGNGSRQRIRQQGLVCKRPCRAAAQAGRKSLLGSRCLDESGRPLHRGSPSIPASGR